MIRKDGYAKILDFGLAKLTDLTGHTIRDFSATSKGVIIGTPAYMSPAQISDEAVDHRTDLWSAGVVLYEFLTGKNPFKGKNRQETFQAVLSKHLPPCSSLNPAVPTALDVILTKLLEKDREKSYQSASALRADLKKVEREFDSSPSWSSGGTLKPAPTRSNAISYFVYSLIALLVIALLGAAYYFYSISRITGAIDWKAAKSIPLTDQPGIEYFPSISPDGRDFVYAAHDNGGFHIFIQRIGSKKRDDLTPGSTGDNTQPAYSPNGETIAFRSERQPAGIYLMNTSGENLRQVSDFGFHPSWSPDGKEIVVSSFGRDQPTIRANPGTSSLTVINIASGEKNEISKVEASFPTWSPSGYRIAYWFYTGTFGRRDIATIPAAGGEPVVIAKDFAVSNWNPVWSPDGKYLYFVSSKSGNMNFWRVQIDERTGQQLSEPEAATTPSKYSRHLGFSKDGKRLVYVQTNDTSNIQGVDFDASTGKVIGEPHWITQGDREISRAELAPDGSQFVMRLIRRTQDDLVTVNRDGSVWRDVTNDEPFDRYVRWSPDGKRIAFTSDRNGGGQVWLGNVDGTGLRQLTFNENEELAAGFPVWSPDGRNLAVFFNERTYIIDPNIGRPDENAEFLPTYAGHRFVGWDWSPDGKMLLGVIPATDTEKRSIGYYSFETKNYVPVIQSSDGIGSWLPDSRRFVYSEGSRIFIADVVTKEKREILYNPQVDIRSPFISRDGKLLYYTAGNSESDIWLLDFAGS
jgi:Tol biopolymer transport system component